MIKTTGKSSDGIPEVQAAITDSDEDGYALTQMVGKITRHPRCQGADTHANFLNIKAITAAKGFPHLRAILPNSVGSLNGDRQWVIPPPYRCRNSAADACLDFRQAWATANPVGQTDVKVYKFMVFMLLRVTVIQSRPWHSSTTPASAVIALLPCCV